MKKKTDGKVRLKIGGLIAEIVLDRPEKHNALTPAMYQQIVDICRKVNESDVNAVLIHGEGNRAFCAGSDINSMDDYEDFWAWRNRVDYITPILGIRKPVVAALKGWTLGGGLEIALACDLRVAARSTVFSAPEVTLGWTGAGGAAQHLTKMCGYGRAMKILLTGMRFSAEEAERMGMIEWLVNDGDELPRAREIAYAIAGFPPVATQSVKAAVRASLDLTVEQGLKYENELMSLCLAKLKQEESEE